MWYILSYNFTLLSPYLVYYQFPPPAGLVLSYRMTATNHMRPLRHVKPAGVSFWAAAGQVL